MMRLPAKLLVCAIPLLLAGAAAAKDRDERQVVAGAPLQLADDDYSADTLFSAQRQVLEHHLKHYRDLPLDAKAEYFEWALWRYHLTSWNQCAPYVQLPGNPRKPPKWKPGSDDSTWNGALLAALAHKYAVTKDRRTLDRICALIDGMHLYFEVTQYPGLAARNVSREDCEKPEQPKLYVAKDGTKYLYRGDPAKGGYNQIAGGLASVLMRVGDDLPAPSRRLAREDLAAMAAHLVDHDYEITMPGGEPTPYGDMTPEFAGNGVPFNAQVAYFIIAAARTFPSHDEATKAKIEKAFRELRVEKHVYYENPWTNLVRPQSLGGSPFLKGMNDRNHLLNAAYHSLALELFDANRGGRAPDGDFLQDMGRTTVVGMDYLATYRNSLCNFMYCGLLSDPSAWSALVDDADHARAQSERLLGEGLEQLRRFPLNRFSYQGQEVNLGRPTWIEERRASDYHWKEQHYLGFRSTGQRTNQVTCGIDYLYAYWLMRYYQLDRLPAAQTRHAKVLGKTRMK